MTSKDCDCTVCAYAKKHPQTSAPRCWENREPLPCEGDESNIVQECRYPDAEYCYPGDEGDPCSSCGWTRRELAAWRRSVETTVETVSTASRAESAK